MAHQPVFKTVSGEIKSLNEATFTVTAIVSKPTVDRDKEIVLPESAKELLPIYQSNGLLLWQHPWQYDELPPPSAVIGKAVDIRILPDRIEVDFQYAVDENPTAKMVWDLIRGGYLKAYSIGFFSRASVTRSSSKAEIDALPPDAREELLSGRCVRVHTQIEWFETSQVFCGSNREALAVLRALQIQSKEADMAESVNEQKPVAKVGHAPTNDIVHRLMGSIESLCSYTDEPPEPEVCAGVTRVLLQIVDDLKVLAGADDDDTALAPEVVSLAASAPVGVAKAGRRFSAKTLDAIKKAMEHHENGMACLKSLLEEDFDDDDGSDVDGEREGEIKPDEADDAKSIASIIRRAFGR